LACLILLSGCSTLEGLWGDLFGDSGAEIEAMPQQLAQEGMEELRAGRYSRAVDRFQTLKDRYPYSRYAILAELKIADALYLNKKYVEALEAYMEFERLHPKNEAVPYVIYQQGMCHYSQMTGYDRDQTPVVHAIQTFARLQQMYPDSRYAAMAAARITEAQNSLAHHEFYVGEYYYSMGADKAALGRFLSLVKNYPDTGFHARAIEYITDIRARMAAERRAEAEPPPPEAPHDPNFVAPEPELPPEPSVLEEPANQAEPLPPPEPMPAPEPTPPPNQAEPTPPPEPIPAPQPRPAPPPEPRPAPAPPPNQAEPTPPPEPIPAPEPRPAPAPPPEPIPAPPPPEPARPTPPPPPPGELPPPPSDMDLGDLPDVPPGYPPDPFDVPPGTPAVPPPENVEIMTPAEELPPPVPAPPRLPPNQAEPTPPERATM
jgi:outer membrane protein assembly factor BamD